VFLPPFSTAHPVSLASLYVSQMLRTAAVLTTTLVAAVAAASIPNYSGTWSVESPDLGPATLMFWQCGADIVMGPMDASGNIVRGDSLYKISRFGSGVDVLP
jgi:hypothetical protein